MGSSACFGPFWSDISIVSRVEGAPPEAFFWGLDVSIRGPPLLAPTTNTPRIEIMGGSPPPWAIRLSTLNRSLQPLLKIDHTEICCQLSCLNTFTKASSTEPGTSRELRERILKIGTWDDLSNITEIEPGRELHERVVKIGNWDDLEQIAEIEPGRELHNENHADWHLRL